jgi:hypothetical protein
MRASGALSRRLTFVSLALTLFSQSAAMAGEITPPAEASLPDTINGPGADRVPPGMACSDSMDFAPEDNLPNPFDADLVAFRTGDATPAQPAASENCGGRARLDLS